MRHSKDKWQRYETKAPKEIEHFIPFYYKENSSLINEKKDNPITFPNYMNWYNEGDNKSQSDQIPVKRSNQQSESERDQKSQSHEAYYATDRVDRRQYQPSYQEIDRSHQQTNKAEDSSITHDKVFGSGLVDDERQEKLKRLRQEVKEYQDYQFRRPFQPSDVPSTWKEERVTAKKTRSTGKRSYHFDDLETKPEQKTIKKTETKHMSQSTVPKRGHLNRGLQSIMDDENNYRFKSSNSSRKSNEMPYFPSYLRKQNEDK